MTTTETARRARLITEQTRHADDTRESRIQRDGRNATVTSYPHDLVPSGDRVTVHLSRVEVASLLAALNGDANDLDMIDVRNLARDLAAAKYDDADLTAHATRNI